MQIVRLRSTITITFLPPVVDTKANTTITIDNLSVESVCPEKELFKINH